MSDVWSRGLCDRKDCPECDGARRGCTWNPNACQVTRAERQAAAEARQLPDVSARPEETAH